MRQNETSYSPLIFEKALALEGLGQHASALTVYQQIRLSTAMSRFHFLLSPVNTMMNHGHMKPRDMPTP